MGDSNREHKVEKVEDKTHEKNAEKISVADVGSVEKAASMFMPKSKHSDKDKNNHESSKRESAVNALEHAATKGVQKATEIIGAVAGKVGEQATKHAGGIGQHLNEASDNVKNNSSDNVKNNSSDNVKNNSSAGSVEKPSSKTDPTQAAIEAMAKSAGDAIKQSMGPVGGAAGQMSESTPAPHLESQKIARKNNC
jgi:hypothetical protein